MWDYNEKVMDHFLNPRNVGEIKDANAIGEVGNIQCGDALKLFLKINDNGIITDAKFQTFGCASAIASSSALTELIKGMTIEDASKITNKDIVKVLGELPEAKIHCSVMGMEALQAAIASYKGEQVKEEKEHKGRIVCHCFQVTDVTIREVARLNNVRNAEDMKNYCKAGGGCGTCLDDIQEILDGLWRKEESNSEFADKESDVRKNGGMSIVQKALKIQNVINNEVIPLLERDGGSIELVDVKDNEVYVKLSGRCGNCPASHVTLKNTVEAKLKEFVDSNLVVRSV